MREETCPRNSSSEGGTFGVGSEVGVGVGVGAAVGEPVSSDAGREPVKDGKSVTSTEGGRGERETSPDEFFPSEKEESPSDVKGADGFLTVVPGSVPVQEASASNHNARMPDQILFFLTLRQLLPFFSQYKDNRWACGYFRRYC